jgi:hypothetical protein
VHVESRQSWSKMTPAGFWRLLSSQSRHPLASPHNGRMIRILKIWWLGHDGLTSMALQTGLTQAP